MAKRMTATQKVAELKRLAGQEKEGLWRRLQLADELLRDDDFMEATYSGSYDAAIEHLGSEYFPVMYSTFPLDEMIAWFRALSHGIWIEEKFDLRRLQIRYAETQTKESLTGTRTSWKKVAEEKTEKLAEAEATVRHQGKQLESLLESSEDKDRRIDELERENAELRGRVAALEEMLGYKREAAGVK